INFIAAYGTHVLIRGQTTAEGKRDAALTIISGQSVGGLAVPSDRLDFLNGKGAYGAAAGLGGVEHIDLWIGGLAEKKNYDSMLGSTFGFVFQMQLENLQNGDRFYYLQRLDGLHFFEQLEGNTFAAIMERATDATHLPSDVFSTPDLILEVDRDRQFNDIDRDGDLEHDDPQGFVIRDNPATSGADSNYLRYTGDYHVVLGGAASADTLIAGDGDDTLHGDGGNDRLEGGGGGDLINGGAGNDIITDEDGDDNIKAGDGNDAVRSGPGADLVLGGRGQDFVVLGSDEGSEVFGGEGNDFVRGHDNAELIFGNEGDDWLEAGAAAGAAGDNLDGIFEKDDVDGHDVFVGNGGADHFIGEGGDDIMVAGGGANSMRGMSGFDWATFKNRSGGVTASLATPNSTAAFETVEGLSGTRFNDRLTGSDVTSATIGAAGFRGSVLDAQGIAAIDGLQTLLGSGVTSFGAGDILLGGDGSDLITGRAGNDIIDGDRWLNVRISVRENSDGTGREIGSANSMGELQSRIFNGTINPGQLVIAREIKVANGANDTDIAVFSGARAEYDISYGKDGTVTIAHVRGNKADGTDTLRNIERARFSDSEIALNGSGSTGKPVIRDSTPTEGQRLTVDTSAISDSNGLGTFRYQWQSSTNGTTWTNIAEATQSSFRPTDAAGQAFGPQAGLLLRVAVSFIDGGGTLETVHSDATDPVGVNWSGSAGSNTFDGPAGDDIADGRNGSDGLNGNAGNDTLNGGSGNDRLNGGRGDDRLDGGQGADTALFARAAADYSFDGTGGTIRITDQRGNEGTDTIRDVETLRFAGTDYAVVTGSPGNNKLNKIKDLDGRQTVFGMAGNDTIDGGAGNDLIHGGEGADRISQNAQSGGRDRVDGGSGEDIYQLLGGSGAETFRIYSRDAAQAAGLTGLSADTEIVVTRNGTSNAAIIAELDDIEQLLINATRVLANGSSGRDTFQLIGDFGGTSLRLDSTASASATPAAARSFIDFSDRISMSPFDEAMQVLLQRSWQGDYLT
ncbi:peroxidase family protein, partial [uncultured Sphingomonas sp.]|uniref:peroxidase family protein n=1 Tax=uncultured Sphingomonas sp. TaxID=158754 RepID=UPI0025CFE850